MDGGCSNRGWGAGGRVESFAFAWGVGRDGAGGYEADMAGCVVIGGFEVVASTSGTGR